MSEVLCVTALAHSDRPVGRNCGRYWGLPTEVRQQNRGLFDHFIGEGVLFAPPKLLRQQSIFP